MLLENQLNKHAGLEQLLANYSKFLGLLISQLTISREIKPKRVESGAVIRNLLIVFLLLLAGCGSEENGGNVECAGSVDQPICEYTDPGTGETWQLEFSPDEFGGAAMSVLGGKKLPSVQEGANVNEIINQVEREIARLNRAKGNNVLEQIKVIKDALTKLVGEKDARWLSEMAEKMIKKKGDGRVTDKAVFSTLLRILREYGNNVTGPIIIPFSQQFICGIQDTDGTILGGDLAFYFPELCGTEEKMNVKSIPPVEISPQARAKLDRMHLASVDSTLQPNQPNSKNGRPSNSQSRDPQTTNKKPRNGYMRTV